MQERSIQQLQEAMAAGELSARALCEGYLRRIEELDRQGPALNSVLELNPDALEIADGLDAERRANGSRGPLHGIPVLVKGNIDTADRMTTTAGSLALEGSIAAQDAFVIRRLRAAGAIILGKTNLSEWANFRSTRSTSGWSSQGGQTKNPYALDRNPCGSSSGSGVAVAADLCAAAIGTETDGSIVCPAHVNGIVGLKPTVGLLGRSGIIPISHSQDTAGPMTRTVADAAALLGPMTGPDPRDPATQGSQGQAHNDYTQFLDGQGLRGARIGVARNLSEFAPAVLAIFEECLQTLRAAGAEVVDPADIPTANQIREHEIEVLVYEYKAGLSRYLAALAPDAPVHSLADLIAFNERERDKVMPYFGQERLLAAQEKGELSDEAYQEALAACRRLARAEGIDATLARFRLDALVAPTGGPAWLTDLVNGDNRAGGFSAYPAAVAGYPNITVPAGFVFGLPVGISFFAGAYREPALIRLAYAFEQARQARRPPRFLPTAALG